MLFALFPHQSSFLLITLCQRLNDFVVSDLPAYGCVQTPLCVSYLVRNRTLQVQEVEVTVEPSDAFMYSGHKQVSSGVFLSGLSYKQARAVSCFYAVQAVNMFACITRSLLRRNAPWDYF